jgi:hypothetical protein
MPPTLNLVDRAPVTFESAIDQDSNFIHQASYVAAQHTFYQRLWSQCHGIDTVVRHHLNLGHAHTVTISSQDRWIRGGFNVCVPIEVRPPPSEATGDPSPASQKLLLRCPLPHKNAEARFPGTVDEKLGCELGAYVWIQERCSDIRIPHLYGFGFSELRQVSCASSRIHYPGRLISKRISRAPSLHTYLTGHGTDAPFMGSAA